MIMIYPKHPSLGPTSAGIPIPTPASDRRQSHHIPNTTAAWRHASLVILALAGSILRAECLGRQARIGGAAMCISGMDAPREIGIGCTRERGRGRRLFYAIQRR